MNIEGIKLENLLLACEDVIEASKEEVVNTYRNTLEKVNKSELTSEQQRVLEELLITEPPYVQKSNDKMRVADGIYRLKNIQEALDILSIEYSDLVISCRVDYVEEFNDDMLTQIKR